MKREELPPALPHPSNPRFVDRTGLIYGRLTVLYYGGHGKNHPVWYCECSCGNCLRVFGPSLASGNTSSCGCYKSETLVARALPYSGTTEHIIWKGMKQRCSDPGHVRYDLYGGRGIKVCDRWLDSFETFYADMGPRPSTRHSIDRINSNGNYEPSNCRWATIFEQANNVKSNKIVTFNGESDTLANWCRRLDVPYARVQNRLRVHKMSFQDAVKPQHEILHLFTGRKR